MLIQLQNKSQQLVKYWVFVVIFNISLIIAMILCFFVFAKNISNIASILSIWKDTSKLLWIMLTIVLFTLAITISEFVLIVRCIKVCNKLLRLNPPMELREKVTKQKNKLMWIIFINIIYLIMEAYPFLSLIAFISSTVLKFLFWREIENIR